MKKLVYALMAMMLIVGFVACGDDDVVVLDGFGIWTETTYTSAMKYGVQSVWDTNSMLVSGDSLGGKLAYVGVNTTATISSDVSIAAGGDGTKSLEVDIAGPAGSSDGIIFQFGNTNDNVTQDAPAGYDTTPRGKADLTAFVAHSIKFAIKPLSTTDLADIVLKVAWGNPIDYDPGTGWWGFFERYNEIDITPYIQSNLVDNGWYPVVIPFATQPWTDPNVGGEIEFDKVAEFTFMVPYTPSANASFRLDNLRIEK